MRNDLHIYDRAAETWWESGSKLNALSLFNEPRFRYFDETIDRWQGLRVLGVGCGGGHTAEFLARRGATVAGLDQSVESIRVAREHATAGDLDIEYQVGHAEQLPFTDHSFDAVLCVDVLEHVDDVAAVIAEIHRVLHPGGLFLFDTINRTVRSRFVMITLLEGILKEIPRGVHDWKKFIKPDELRAMLAAAKFVDHDLKGFDVRGRNRDGTLDVAINDNLAVNYIGTARRPDLD